MASRCLATSHCKGSWESSSGPSSDVIVSGPWQVTTNHCLNSAGTAGAADWPGGVSMLVHTLYVIRVAVTKRRGAMPPF